MAVKIILTRRVPTDKSDVFKELVIRLRTATMGQPGYIAGETLQRVDHVDESVGEWVVISKWQSRYHWDEWYQNPQRMEIQQEIDSLLGTPTVMAIYEYV